MPSLTPIGQEKINELSQRYGFSHDAVINLLQALIQGNTTQAQFNHPEFGGMGQWMSGGMMMIGDMFNHTLKSKVNNICVELSQLIQSHQLIQETPHFEKPAFLNSNQGNWWPSEFGSPSASGAQNNLRYAYFANSRRLVIDMNGQITVYDTLNHQIGGVSQQQGSNTSLCFTSQYGTINISQLPIVAGNSTTSAPGVQSVSVAPDTSYFTPGVQSVNFAPDTAPGVQGVSVANEDILAKIEGLAELHKKGILSKKEFADKKAELLSRL